MKDAKKQFETRRSLLKAASGSLLLASLPAAALAQQQNNSQDKPQDKPADGHRPFDPAPGDWRTFDVTTSVSLEKTGPSKIWVPIPSVNTPWQQSLSSTWTGNAKSARIATDPRFGAKYVVAEFDGSAQPVLEVVSRVRTSDRAHETARKDFKPESAAALHKWMQPTDLMPLDGIVRVTAKQITEGAKTDEEKVARIYNWIIVSTYREPKVRGCGTGDIKAMLETKNFGGKCGDINGLFVGLCRAAGVPARDAFGLRLAPSAFGYRELGGKPESLKGAQHCRAEVYLRKHGWVAMDPADVGKVMRQETSEWIKDADHPLVAPVRKALYGGWEGNWMAYNFAHDVKLEESTAVGKLGFFMYPQAETAGEAYDPLSPDAFKYTIASKVVSS